MIFVWEAALSADRSGIDREDIRYIPTQSGSPYAEVSFEDLNERTLSSPVVEVNPLYRFSKVFSDMFDLDLHEYQESRELFFDIYMHHMVQLDLRQKLSREEYQHRYILEDCLSDVCQIDSDKVIRQLEKEKVPLLIRQVWKLYRCGSSLLLFRETMQAMYPESILYENKEKEDQLLIYIGEKETEEERARIELIQAVFLPLNVQVHLFWEHHFGIIGIDETMVFDEMALY